MNNVLDCSRSSVFGVVLKAERYVFIARIVSSSHSVKIHNSRLSGAYGSDIKKLSNAHQNPKAGSIDAMRSQLG